MFSPAPRRAKTKCLRIISRWLRQQPDGGNSSSAHCVDDAGHHGELQRRIAPDKRGAVVPHLENFSQPIVQVRDDRSEEHTSELQSQSNLVCRLLLEKKKKKTIDTMHITKPHFI